MTIESFLTKPQLLSITLKSDKKYLYKRHSAAFKYYIIIWYISKTQLSPYKPSVLFVRHRQTVHTPIRRRRKRRLIRVSTVFLQSILLKFTTLLEISCRSSIILTSFIKLLAIERNRLWDARETQVTGVNKCTCWISVAPVFSFIYCWVLIFALSPCCILIYMF